MLSFRNGYIMDWEKKGTSDYYENSGASTANSENLKVLW